MVGNQVLYPEARAAVAAANRGGRIDDRMLRRAVEMLDDLHDELLVVTLDRDLARTAGELAERHGLRGYDAVHLAAALQIDAPDLVLATWDAALADAAHDAGCIVAPRHA